VKRSLPGTTNKAVVWVALWERMSPTDMRSIPTRHKESGGELRFALKAMKRRWAFDWCIESLKIAVEVDGGKRMAKWCAKTGRCVVVGRHNQDQDLEKHNAATMLGWAVFHFSPDMLKNDPVGCVECVAQAVRMRRRSIV